MFLPLDFDPSGDLWGNWYLRAIGKLGETTALREAQAELDTLTGGFAEELPFGGAWEFEIEFLHEGIVGDSRTALLVLFGAVGFVLLIACINVTNLLLARTNERGRELAVRSALGAGRFRLVRQLLTENLVLAAVGGGIGLLLALWIIDWLRLLKPAIPRIDEINLDPTVLGFAGAVCLFAAVGSAILPALNTSRPDMMHTFRTTGIQAGGKPRQRLRNTLVIGEVVLAVVLVVGRRFQGNQSDRRSDGARGRTRPAYGDDLRPGHETDRNRTGDRTGRSLGSDAVCGKLVVRGVPNRCGHFRRCCSPSYGRRFARLLSPRPAGNKRGPARGSALRMTLGS